MSDKTAAAAVIKIARDYNDDDDDDDGSRVSEGGGVDETGVP